MIYNNHRRNAIPNHARIISYARFETRCASFTYVIIETSGTCFVGDSKGMNFETSHNRAEVLIREIFLQMWRKYAVE